MYQTAKWLEGNRSFRGSKGSSKWNLYYTLAVIARGRRLSGYKSTSALNFPNSFRHIKLRARRLHRLNRTLSWTSMMLTSCIDDALAGPTTLRLLVEWVDWPLPSIPYAHHCHCSIRAETIKPKCVWRVYTVIYVKFWFAGHQFHERALIFLLKLLAYLFSLLKSNENKSRLRLLHCILKP